MDRVAETRPGVADRIEREPLSRPEEICAILGRELRSPLSTIQKYLELLANDGVGPITAEQREFLAVAIRNVERLAMVANDWYDLSRIEAGHSDVVIGAVDLEDIVDVVLAGLRPSMFAKGQQVTADVQPNMPHAVGDSRALMRAVGNLLSNAHKYTPPGGSIAIKLSLDVSGRIRLDVVDDGIGIPDEDLPHLFQKYFRSSLTNAEPGTGLGLVIVKDLVDCMGGEVAVKSALGQGSTFTIWLEAVPVPV
jgi:two-component system, OmpR family, sensor histidine kinase ResE